MIWAWAVIFSFYISTYQRERADTTREVILPFLQANVVCKQLGFINGASKLYGFNYYGSPLEVTAPKFVSGSYKCNGSEAGLDECQHVTSPDCTVIEGAQAPCDPSPTLVGECLISPWPWTLITESAERRIFWTINFWFIVILGEEYLET